MSQDEQPRKAMQVRVEGRVQGVWFRGWVVQEAVRRGLQGWVRNRSDGSVEALFAGPPLTVDEMVELCRQGPPAARVLRLTAVAGADPGRSGFHALATL
ncbi:MAG: acylphosphatase [Rhodospirillales bacterium]